MTKLLVSVRDAAEAEIALAGGADLIDVKEPTRGPLGAADAATIRSIADQIAGRVLLSAALGELVAGNRLDPSLAGQVRYAKFGMAGCGRLPDWTRRWQAALGALPREVVPVAVVYADWPAAAAPQPREVMARAAGLGCGAVLIDTFDKAAGPLDRHVALAELARWLAAVREAGLVSVVAGGLGETQLQRILPLGPDYVGVRKAGCIGDRTGRLDRKRVCRLAELAHDRSRDRAVAGS